MQDSNYKVEKKILHTQETWAENAEFYAKLIFRDGKVPIKGIIVDD